MASVTTHTFLRATEDSLITIPCRLDADPLTLALDTGASHTTIDLTPMLMAGYERKDAVGTEQIETASGVVEGLVFLVKRLTGLGIVKQNVHVFVYDFFAYQLITDFDGVLGLDFFSDCKFCVDMAAGEITIQQK